MVSRGLAAALVVAGVGQEAAAFLVKEETVALVERVALAEAQERLELTTAAVAGAVVEVVIHPLARLVAQERLG